MTEARTIPTEIRPDIGLDQLSRVERYLLGGTYRENGKMIDFQVVREALSSGTSEERKKLLEPLNGEKTRLPSGQRYNPRSYLVMPFIDLSVQDELIRGGLKIGLTPADFDLEKGIINPEWRISILDRGDGHVVLDPNRLRELRLSDEYSEWFELDGTSLEGYRKLDLKVPYENEV